MDIHVENGKYVEIKEMIDKMAIELQRLESLIMAEELPDDEGFDEITEDDLEELMQEAKSNEDWISFKELPKPDDL